MHRRAYLGVKMKLTQLLMAIVIGAVLAACAVQGYEGPALPDSETALVQTIQNGELLGSSEKLQVRGGFVLTAVEGRDLKGVSQARVLPGRRCISLLVWTPGDRVESVLCFSAVAGRAYEARFLTPRGRGFQGEILAVWLVDLENGETVASGVLRPASEAG